METQNKKTGTTPLVEGGLGVGEVIGVVEVKQVMIKLRDGHGREMTKLALVVPGGEIYFLDDRTVNTKPAQGWVKSAVISKLGNS